MRVLPGRLLSFGIDSLIGLLGVIGGGSTASAAKAAEKALAIALFILLGVVFGLISALAARRGARHRQLWGTLAGLALFALLALITPGRTTHASPWASLLWLAGLGAGWGG